MGRVGTRTGFVVLATTMMVAIAGGDAGAQDSGPPELLGAEAATLAREPIVRPAFLGSDPLDALRYADVTEGLDLIEVPEADNQGDAALELPLAIPHGRGGFEPDLGLSYNSGGAASWLGTGWDLDVGAITIDTRWGVPRYDRQKETESYILDGDVLSPTAVRADFADRVADRADFTRRVETEHELIIRHGDNPTNYWWEVRDKSGGARWYGGTPDNGGPDGERDDDDPGLDEDAVLRGPGGAIYRWALSARRDSYINLVRYEYDKSDGIEIGEDDQPLGRAMYLERIRYTGALPDSGQPEDPAYEIRFLRDDDVAGETRRKDVTVDGTGGFVEVTRDLLRRIEVWTGEPKDCDVAEDPVCLREFDQRSKAWGLNYREGAFGKALLKSIDQLDADNEVRATHELGYYDDVRDEEGDYDGFRDVPNLETVDDDLDAALLTPFGVSALGGSDTNAADVHAYIGFSPVGPTKTTSAGASVALNGGYTQALLEMVDINGDGLPDKVYKKGPSAIKFRLNQARPGGTRTFGPEKDLTDLGNLSSSFNLSLGGGPEGYIGGVSAAFSVQGSVAVGETYFEDVNGDNLPDFVNAGTVLFNHLDADGVPTFSSTSEPTRVPIGVGDPTFDDLQSIENLEARQRELSPLQDTVRRWVAPYAGVVDIDAPVRLDPPPDTRRPRPTAYDGDGVRVAVQVGPAEAWAARLETPGDSTTPVGLSAVEVQAGQAIYFRTQSIDHGALDQVRWDPRIAYTTINDDEGATPPTDADGRSQRVYQASDDFTLAGRPAAPLVMPLDGTVHLEAVLRKTRRTSDDVRVLVERNGMPVVDHTIDDDALHPDGLNLSTDIQVTASTDAAPEFLTVRLVADTPIDASAIDWAPRLYYTSATRNGEDVPVTDPTTGRPSLEMSIPFALDIYPRIHRLGAAAPAPVEPFGGPAGDLDVVAEIVADERVQPNSVIVVAVKQRQRLLAKKRFTFSPNDSPLQPTILTLEDVPFSDDEDTWIELVVPDAVAADGITSRVVKIGASDTGIEVPHTLYSTGLQGMFPLGHRGWAYAGYDGSGPRADAPIEESVFDIDGDDFPDHRAPTGFDDTEFKSPTGRAYPYIPHQLELLDEDRNVVGHAPVWRGFKDNTVGGATFARTSRKGADDPGAVPQPGSSPSVGGASVRAVRKVGMTLPQFGIGAGAIVANAHFAMGWSFGLLDYTDVNGDGFPDVVASDYTKYTGPRGGFFAGDDDTSGRNSQDTTLGVGAGFAGSTGKIATNSEGDVGGSGGGNAADTGGSASEELSGFSLGAAFGVDAQFTNPSAADDTLAAAIDQSPFPLLPDIEIDHADINGDGLPDEIRTDPGGLRVKLNLGYGFTDEIRWAGGGFQTNQSYSGTFGGTLGFQSNKREFAGGLSYTEGVDFPQFSWIDVDGDGVLDRLTKAGTEIRVAFGTGSGVMDDIRYGSFQQGSIDLGGEIFNGAGIPSGEQITQSRSRGFGGGLDFMIPAGPLCPLIKQCYIIINPGLHFDHSVSNDVVALTDVNGDGYPDSVKSNGDDEIQVQENTRGRTNLLRSVKTPIGGEIRLGYERHGNTTAQPESQWALSWVEHDDGRPGDGPDVALTTYEYRDGRYDPLEREQLGYATVLEHHRRFADDGDPTDDTLLRTVEREYHNETVFDSGLIKSEKLVTPAGRAIKETRTTWDVRNLATGDPLDRTPPANGQGNVGLLSKAGAPERTKVEQLHYDADGSVGQRTANEFTYDQLGNIVTQIDRGELETPSDDLIATTTYSTCDDSRGDGCPEAPPEPRSPLWNPHVCPSWTSLPAHYEVRDHAGTLLRERDGTPGICDNGGSIHLEERGSDGQVAVTDLDYDDWGNYAHVEYPANAAGERLVVDYVFDAHSHANIVDVVETRRDHQVSASAEYDGRTGRVTKRTDPNGQTTSYTYDSVGRLKELRGPSEQGGTPTITFDYHPTDPDYAYGTARHFDAFHSSDPIETVSFVDGRGRETETKQDASVHDGIATGTSDVMTVSGAVEFDDLGREVKQWHPTKEPLGTAGAYKYSTADEPPTETSYDVADRVVRVKRPDGLVSTRAYDFAGEDDPGVTLFRTTAVDPRGKQQRIYGDARGHVRAVLDGTPALRTHHRYDPIGQLVGVTENGGATTTHTYDRLGRRTSTTTPDGGRTEHQFDAAGNRTVKTTPRLRAAGEQITYEYDIDRLTRVEHPGSTPDVTYTYGGLESPAVEGGVGRIVRVTDGARDQSLAYDERGEVAGERSTMLVHNLGDADGDKMTFETRFSYDAFGRLRELTYPDGEVLRNDYDSGGLLKEIAGTKAGHEYRYLDRLEYDEFSDRRLQVTGNDVRTTYDYNALTRRLARQLTTTPAREIQDFNYTYDEVGNVKRLRNDLPAPTASLSGGPVTQNFRYDPYYRLTSADGTYAFGSGKRRDYTYTTSYDAHGNMATKTQTDLVFPKPKGAGNPQKTTTYDLGTLTYDPDHPHRIATAGPRSYTYDADGNFTGWTQSTDGNTRTATHDATGLPRTIADQGSTTAYTYDGDGHLAIERGPAGETVYVNPWYTVRNGSERIKYVFAGSDRLSGKQVVDDGTLEFKRYFLHKDLQGSTNVVTDDAALVFQHLEHFPFGEDWVREQSTEQRTPYHFAGGYHDEIRNLTNLGARWYDAREQVFYTPDPVLVEDPEEAVEDPGLLTAYSYAEGNPLVLADAGGRATTSVRAALTAAIGDVLRPRRPGALRAMEAAVAGALLRSMQASAARAQAQGGTPEARDVASAAGLALQVADNAGARASGAAGSLPTDVAGAADGDGGSKRLSRFWTEKDGEDKTALDRLGDRLDAKPLIQINLVKGKDGHYSLQDIKLSPGVFKQFKIPGIGKGAGATKLETDQGVEAAAPAGDLDAGQGAD